MTDPTPEAEAADELSFGRMFRRFFQIITLLFCLFLVVRTVFVEPHGVPTGSMAPTIFGHHRQCPCPRCEFPIVVGTPPEDQFNPQTAAYCPNCGLAKINMIPLSDNTSGDRLLVDRMVFRVRSPKRWEVAVFHAPDDSKIPYVKRVVGLPGERIRIRDGDAYANGELLRKPLDAIREMKVPFFDMDHPPQPMGWASRWVVERLDPPKLPPGGNDSSGPIEAIVAENRLILDAGAGPGTVVGLGYRHRNIDTGLDEVIRDDLGYNGSRGVPKPVHDFILECEIEVLAGSGAVSFRLGDGSTSIRLDLAVGAGNSSQLAHDGGTAPVRFPDLNLAAGQRYRLELAFVDRQAIASLNGKPIGPALVLAVPNLGLGSPLERKGTMRPLQLQAEGVSAVLHHLKLSRDVDYRSEGENGIDSDCQLGPTEYFLLGDNSPSSEDSRAWKKPGVPEGDFIGKPFLVHQPLRIGRVVLNGNERRFQTIDWDRFRFLR